MLSAITSFLVARHVTRDAVHRSLPERLKRYEQRLTDGGFTAVLVVRLLTFTMPPVMFLVGVTGVRFGTMVLATVPGFAPAVALDVFLGEGLMSWLAA